MCKEYIEREAAIAETRKPRLTDAELRRRLAQIPAADVRPVVRKPVVGYEGLYFVSDVRMSCNRGSAKGYKYTFRDMREES